MGKCDGCGNEYDKPFEVTLAGRRYVFDSFECAIDTLVPRCSVCGIRVVGQGVEGRDSIFCCASCARRADVSELRGSARASRGGSSRARARQGLPLT